MSFTLRHATPEDIDDLLALWLEAAENDGRPADTPGAVAALLERDPQALIVAADDGGELIGSVIAGWDGWRYHLYRLAVRPQWRRRGVGTALLDAAEARLAEFGATRADAMVLDGNDLGRRLWRARGYRRQSDWRRWVKQLRLRRQRDRTGGPADRRGRTWHAAGMVESVAVLSDIHGVLPALDAVLAEPALQQAERIVLTGDIAAGPQPAQTLDRLMGLGDRVTWVRGNTDRELVELARDADADIPSDITRWAAGQLSSDQVDWLAGLPATVTLDVAGFGDVVFCHATPRDDSEVVVVDSRLERWAEVLGDLPDQVMTVVCGHTHMPFARLANRRQIVNPGSVGMPYGRQGAHWALLGGGIVEMRRTQYDAGVACEQVRAQSSYPDVAAWADYFLHSRASDAEALTRMAPKDGRPRVIMYRPLTTRENA